MNISSLVSFPCRLLSVYWSMDRWRVILKVPICPNRGACYRVAVSLCLSPTSKTLTVCTPLLAHSNSEGFAFTVSSVSDANIRNRYYFGILSSPFSFFCIVSSPVFYGPFFFLLSSFIMLLY